LAQEPWHFCNQVNNIQRYAIIALTWVHLNLEMKNLKESSYLNALYSLHNAQVDRDGEEIGKRVRDVQNAISHADTIGRNELITAHILVTFFSSYIEDCDKDRMRGWLNNEVNRETYKDYAFFMTRLNYSATSFNVYFQMIRLENLEGVGFEFWIPARFGEEFLDAAMVVSFRILEIKMNERMKFVGPGDPKITYRFFQTAAGEPGIYMSEKLRYSPFLICRDKGKTMGYYWFLMRLEVWKGLHSLERMLRNLKNDMLK